MAGAILVFIAATGQFVIPDLLVAPRPCCSATRSSNSLVLSDWPFGSAIACVAMLIVMRGFGCSPHGG
jgi:ABC-type spermidine/putrescine transport system permease subunit I